MAYQPAVGYMGQPMYYPNVCYLPPINVGGQYGQYGYNYLNTSAALPPFQPPANMHYPQRPANCSILQSTQPILYAPPYSMHDAAPPLPLQVDLFSPGGFSFEPSAQLATSDSTLVDEEEENEESEENEEKEESEQKEKKEEKTKEDTALPQSKDYWQNGTILDAVFAKLGTQELLLISRVCKKWYSAVKDQLRLITHLKVTSPSSSYLTERWPCMHLPESYPCSRERYFCAELMSKNFLTNTGMCYFKQIDAIVDDLKANTITSLDIASCPRLPSSLCYLLSQFSKDLECLSLSKVPVLADYNYNFWKMVNLYLPQLKKLAFVNIGYLPTDMPVLEQLDEFHLASSFRVEADTVQKLLSTLGNNLRKLSLNLVFPQATLVKWCKKCPKIVSNITHLELNLKEPSFSYVARRFTSLTHLTLLLPDRKAVYLEVLKNLHLLKRLTFLQLIEDRCFPQHRLIFSMKAQSASLAPVPSLKELCLEVSIADYREVQCLHRLFPNLEKVIFRSLSFDSSCNCSRANPLPYRVELTNCKTCRDDMKKLLLSNGKLRTVLGIEPESYYNEKYPREEWGKCRYRWL